MRVLVPEKCCREITLLFVFVATISKTLTSFVLWFVKKRFGKYLKFLKQSIQTWTNLDVEFMPASYFLNENLQFMKDWRIYLLRTLLKNSGFKYWSPLLLLMLFCIPKIRHISLCLGFVHFRWVSWLLLNELKMNRHTGPGHIIYC